MRALLRVRQFPPPGLQSWAHVERAPPVKLASLARGGRDGTLIIVDRQIRELQPTPVTCRAPSYTRRFGLQEAS